jgi:putative Mg2+ transporter-C (MgtC) family protein
LPMIALQMSLSLPIIIAAVLGALIGTERSLAGKHAGMRTYALVAMGSALFVVSGQLLPLVGLVASFDPSRIAAAIVMGIGFIGSGVAFARSRDGQSGELTTAAGIWVAAGIGVACGLGLYILALIAAVSTLVVFTFLMKLEIAIERRFPEKGVDSLQ